MLLTVTRLSGVARSEMIQDPRATRDSRRYTSHLQALLDTDVHCIDSERLQPSSVRSSLHTTVLHATGASLRQGPFSLTIDKARMGSEDAVRKYTVCGIENVLGRMQINKV
jgi:hypothetical protein